MLQDIQAALANQASNGSVISVAAGAVCRGQLTLTQRSADVEVMASSQGGTSGTVCTHTSTGCTPDSFNIAHNFVEGDIAVFGDEYYNLPGGILYGQNYFVHVIDSTHFQVTFPLPYSMGGQVVQLTSTGGPNGGIWWWGFYRRSQVTPGQNYGQRGLNWIILRTATPDSAFVPPGTRIQGPIDSTGHPTSPTNWLPKMFTITMANTYQGVASANQLFSLTDTDGNDMSMIGYFRIVGAHFTFDPSLDTSGGKPVTHYGMINSSPPNSDFLVDRSFIDPPGHPDEETGLLHFNGTNVGMIDSYSDNFDYYHPAFRGMGVTLVNSNQFTISAGTYSFASGTATLPSTVTVTTTGAPTTSSNGYVYFGTDGTLYVALPPGVTGTGSGYSPLRVFTLGTQQTGWYAVDSGSTPQFPNTPQSTPGYLYFADPVTSNSSSCSSTTSLFPSLFYNQAPSGFGYNGGSSFLADVATRFYPDTALYFCGWNVYIDPADPATSHKFTLWSESGTALVQQTAATTSGKIFVAATTPYLLTANTFYRVGYQYTVADIEWANGFQNYDPNGGLTGTTHASQYAASTGSNNFADNWPKTFDGRPAFAMFSVLNFSTAGLTTASNNVDVFSDGIDTEGCQCMVSGLGPGPYVFKDNYTIGSGNVWHFDDSGGYTLSRHDYTLYRNWWYAPLSQMFTADGGNTASDGMQHGHRHALEWKQGNCASLVGNIFDTSWVEMTPFGDLFEASGINGAPGVCGTSNRLIYGSVSDFDIHSNTFMHTSSVNSVFGPTPGAPPTFPQRFRFSNNLMLDISGTKYCALGSGFCSSYSYGAGLVFQIAQMEDFTMTHNTMVANNAASRLPFILLASVDNQEGFNIQNNILWINGVNMGYDGTQNDTCGYTNGTDSGCWGNGTYCKNLAGIAAFNCAYINSSWINNLITGSPTQAQIQQLWPNNTVPANPSNLSALDWFSYSSPSTIGNYNLASSSPYISGGGQKASDDLNMGVNYDQLQADQGYVTLNGVTNVTASSAQINFVAPDSQACPVDYSATDPTVSDSSMVRVQDTGTTRARNVSLTGLTAGQLYYFRVDCAVNQPMGKFKTQ